LGGKFLTLGRKIIGPGYLFTRITLVFNLGGRLWLFGPKVGSLVKRAYLVWIEGIGLNPNKGGKEDILSLVIIGQDQGGWLRRLVVGFTFWIGFPGCGWPEGPVVPN